MSEIQSKIVGTGACLPERILTNADLEKMVDTSDAWIRERTGIGERHIASKDQRVSDLALMASRQALEQAGLQAADIDVIIVATVTPDNTMPSAACTLQAKLGCNPIMAFDLSAACTGFVYGLSVADSMIRAKQAKNVLVVGSEKLSSIINYRDRETCILFGDGAGAMVLTASNGQSSSSRFMSSHMRANGHLGDILSLESGRPQDPLELKDTKAEIPFVQMKGRDVFKAAVRALTESCNEVLKASQLSASDVDWLVPHQANIRIIQAVGDAVGISKEKTIVNIEKMGNVSSATIPIAFSEAVRDGRVHRGQKVLFTAFGGGLTYGAILFTY